MQLLGVCSLEYAVVRCMQFGVRCCYVYAVWSMQLLGVCSLAYCSVVRFMQLEHAVVNACSSSVDVFI